MFRLGRFAILLFLAFAAGVWVGKRDHQEACRVENGTFIDGLCFIEEIRK